MATPFLELHQLFIGHVVDIRVVGIISHLLALFEHSLELPVFVHLGIDCGMPHRSLQHLSFAHSSFHIVHGHGNLYLTHHITFTI